MVRFLLHSLQSQGILGGIEFRVNAALPEQLLMGAAFGDVAIGDGHDPVGRTDGAQAVGNDQCSSALSQGIESTLDLSFCHGVQSGGRLVQNQDGRVLQEDPGDGNTLLLTAGEEGSPLAHVGIEASGIARISS